VTDVDINGQAWEEVDPDWIRSVIEFVRFRSLAAIFASVDCVVRLLVGGPTAA